MGDNKSEQIPIDMAGRVLYFTSKIGIPGMVLAFLLWEGDKFLTGITDKLSTVIGNQASILLLLQRFCGKGGP